MKKQSLIPIILLFTVISVSSCKKDDDNDKSKNDLLTQKGWKIVTILDDPGTGVYENFPIDECNKDDVLKFETNHTYHLSIGTPCDPSDSDETGSWSLSSDEKTLTVDGDDATIESLDEHSLVVFLSETYLGVTYRTKTTFGH